MSSETDVPSNALNDAILNAAILHVVKNRSVVFASGMSILFRDPTNSSPRVPKENGPSRGRTEAALIQTPDGWGYRGNVPIGAFPQHWNIPTRANLIRQPENGSPSSGLFLNV